jgi:hypothetical protein
MRGARGMRAPLPIFLLLAQRAWPFLEMMRSTRAEGGNIVWGI